jgi:hypothetical protein
MPPLVHVPVVVLVAVTVMLADVEGSMDGVGRDECEAEKEPVPVGEGAGVSEALTVGEPDKVAVSVDSTQIADESGERVDVMEPVVVLDAVFVREPETEAVPVGDGILGRWGGGIVVRHTRRGGAAVRGADSR